MSKAIPAVEVEDDDFLSQVAAMEADALSTKRRKTTTTATIKSGTTEDKGHEGAYTAALKGSKSFVSQQQPFNYVPNYGSKSFGSVESAAAAAAGGGGGSCFKCGKSGHWSRDCSENSYGGRGGDSSVPEEACPCGLGACNVLTANTEKNRGRKFYKCPLREENGGCGFFEWCDKSSATDNMTGKSQIYTSNPSVPELSCPCGAGSCLILTAKTGKNIGQQFYRCPPGQRDLRDYEFTSFQHELEDMDRTHPHAVRREIETIYRDEFALQIIMDEWPVIYEQELEGWARSFYTISGHMDTILAYATPDTHYSAFNLPVYQQAATAVQNELRSLPIARAFDVLSELDQIHYEQSSVAGYDYNGPKGPFMGENHKQAIRRARATLTSALQDEDGRPEHVLRTYVPDVGYTCTQLTDLTKKTKVKGVWGRAFHYILLEGTTARPLLNNFIQGDSFFHIGDDPTLSVPRILSLTSGQCKWLCAVDWSGFDSSVSRCEINAAFNLLKGMVQFPNYETEQAFELSRQLFIHKKIAAPNGRIYWSHKGIPSGSYYTSIIRSIVNRLRIEYLWRLKFGRGPKVCYTQGDDSLIGDDELFPPEEIAELAAPYGWTINPDKTEYSTSPEFVTFLGRTTRGGFNSRELMRCLRLLVYPEYPVESGRISAYRARAIADDCGGMSQIINLTARRLRRHYGIADEEEIPRYFLRYYP